MSEHEKQAIANDAVKAADKVAQSFGQSIATMPKQMTMMMVSAYVEGAKMAMLAIKKFELQEKTKDAEGQIL